MPFYNLVCKKKHVTERFISFAKYDSSMFGSCERCHHPVTPSASNNICVYGTTKYHDKSLADASEAAGKTISSTKEADALEKSHQMYRITNPSTYRRKRDDRARDKAWREKLSRVL